MQLLIDSVFSPNVTLNLRKYDFPIEVGVRPAKRNFHNLSMVVQPEEKRRIGVRRNMQKIGINNITGFF